MPADEIKHYEPPFFCEACQRSFAMGMQARLADGSPLTVCDLCWNQIPVGQKVKLASDAKHHQTMRNAFDAAAAWLDVFHRALDVIERNQKTAEDLEAETGDDDEAWLN